MSLGPLSASDEVSDGSAVLTRQFRVQLLDFSDSGCLLESNRPVAVGTAAMLRVTFDGYEYVDGIQVVRCRQIAGAGSVYHVGAQFLWTEMPHERSIRRGIAARYESLALMKTTRVM